MHFEVSKLKNPWLWFVMAHLWACSSSTGGNSAIQPFPDAGTYSGTKNDNIVNVRLSPDGINYINSQWQGLIEAFAPGQILKLPFPCTISSFPVIGDMAIGDQGPLNCTSDSCGQMDGICDNRDAPREVEARIVSFQLTPQGPDQLSASLSLELNTGKIFIDTVDRSHGSCLFFAPIKCSILFDSSRQAPNANSVQANVKFVLNSTWDNLLSFEVPAIQGVEICEASGALPPPACLEPDDIDISRENACGATTCSLADFGPVKNFVLRQISPLLESQIRSTVDQLSCLSCGDGKPACPQVAGSSSTCVDGQCIDSASKKCVPRVLGLEGRLYPALVSAGLGVPPESSLELSVGAGSSVSIDQGISLGTRGGLKAVSVSDCVPQLPQPTFRQVLAPNFDAEAQGSGYHVGLGISSPFLEQALYEAHQSGALCIALQSTTIRQVNTGVFKLLLPSLGRLATRDGKDAPMMIALRPGKAPTVKIGAGTADPVTKKPIDPLLTIELKDLTIDFYAGFDDRQARLFSLTADVSLPLSLIVQGCSSVQPALGDVRQLVTNIRTLNNEILAEDPKLLEDLIPAVIGLAEPAIASALSTYSLPQFGGFSLKVNSLKGIGLDAATSSYNHLGIFAQLLGSSASCAESGPTLQAFLIAKEGFHSPIGGKEHNAWPTVVLSPRNLGSKGPFEYTFRVDGGLWSTYKSAINGHVRVSHPLFLLQGPHRIELRSRILGIVGSDSPIAEIPLVVDSLAPEVKLSVDNAKATIEVWAHDAVTPVEQLEFAYRLGQQPPTTFGASRAVDLETVERAGGLVVLVRDREGNIGEARYRVAGLESRSVDVATDSAQGCSSSQGEPWLFLVGLSFVVNARLKRRGLASA